VCGYQTEWASETETTNTCINRNNKWKSKGLAKYGMLQLATELRKLFVDIGWLSLHRIKSQLFTICDESAVSYIFFMSLFYGIFFFLAAIHDE